MSRGNQINVFMNAFVSVFGSRQEISTCDVQTKLGFSDFCVKKIFVSSVKHVSLKMEIRSLRWGVLIAVLYQREERTNPKRMIC